MAVKENGFITKPANYIIFHPEIQREEVSVNGKALVNNRLITNWQGKIFADQFADPYVYNTPWLYSYCHASQLRRNKRRGSYLRQGSVLLFVSGQYAEKKILSFDTVFIVGDIQLWEKPSVNLPIKFRSHFENKDSDLWNSHFSVPSTGVHAVTSHTYECDIWKPEKARFSFLPLDETGNRSSILFEELPIILFNKISKSVKGKYPILLLDDDIQILLDLINSRTKTMVIGNIKRLQKKTTKSKVKC